MIGQLPSLLGIPKGNGESFGQLGHIIAHLGDANGWTTILGLGSLAVLRPTRSVELRREGISLWLANVRARARDMPGRSGLAADVGESHISRDRSGRVQDARAASAR